MSRLLVKNAVAALSAVVIAFSAEGQVPADVLVRSTEVVVTRTDWDAELTRIPAEQRVPFATSPQRVQNALGNLLVTRTLAERARAQGLDKDPVVQRRIALEADRVLTDLMLERIEATAGAEFDRVAERNGARARELYLVNRGKYVVPEEVEVSHILFDTTKKSKEAALASANEARAKLLAGADFGALAVAVSDDSSAARNKGRLDFHPRGRFEPPFEAAAFALKNVGDISEPVLTRYGYHLIRLEGRKPSRPQTFDEVREQIVAELRQKAIGEARESTFAAIRGDRRLQVNQEAVDALVVQVDVPPLPVAPVPNAVTPVTAPPAR